jgi:hypothetical protein
MQRTTKIRVNLYAKDERNTKGVRTHAIFCPTSYFGRSFFILQISLEKPPIFTTSLCKIAGCNYSYINQLGV